MALGRIKAVRFYYGRIQVKKRRSSNGHSQRWSKHLKRKQHGDLIQIDNMSINPAPGWTLKQFKTVSPITKITVAELYSSAQCARDFLRKLIKHLPFKIRSFQVDGGGEFRAQFEQACKELEIPLYVLPPRPPELNGYVERCNGTTKYEFTHCTPALCV